ncbi:protein of unknown function [Paenibacillus sp. UNCCL117]|uniref:DUF4871 domain-containing protein n=1 Tax=unclassified Paenibacillus TaxID=185978 RepID=UPI00087F3F3C|nr:MULTISPECIES: DUF4871 domain-containing protein [unclassified Paenibacillus]SDC96119.1 protein of unknown function [Paenibacillus sp. cl123]SFW30219.1 protein of unknown function [Paenibacillus sp. UNCCL117]
MNEEKPAWAKSMADPPFVSGQFTAELKHNILRRTSESRGKRFSIMKAVCVPLVIASLVIGLLYFKEEAFLSRINPQGEVSGGPAIRNSYYEQGRLLFTLNPEPYTKAGETAGYMIHFEEPLGTFMGKTLTLYAVHQLSGLKETVSSEVITKSSPGYPGLERYTARFTLPVEGVWELHVLLDDKPYGNVQLFMLEPSWDITPKFQSGAYAMRGVEKKVGFIDAGFIADKPQKYMWHFWGNEDLLNGPFEVKAVKQGTDKIIDVYSSNQLSSTNALGGELNGADRNIVISMKLPEAGRWRLLPYIGGRLLESIVVEVLK